MTPIRPSAGSTGSTLTADRFPSDSPSRCLDCGGPLAVRERGLFDTRFGVPGEYSYAACGECGLEQLASPPSEEELDRLYGSYYNFGGERGTAYNSLRSRPRFPAHRSEPLIDGDIFFHGKKGEAGGSGFRLQRGAASRQLGERMCGGGLEPTHKRRGGQGDRDQVHETPEAEFLSVERPYDVASCPELPEHTTYPRGMLRHVHDPACGPAGCGSALPTGESVFRTCSARSWINWHVPFHVVLFDSIHWSASRGDWLSCRGRPQETPALGPLQIAQVAACLCAPRGPDATASQSRTERRAHGDHPVVPVSALAATGRHGRLPRVEGGSGLMRFLVCGMNYAPEPEGSQVHGGDAEWLRSGGTRCGSSGPAALSGVEGRVGVPGLGLCEGDDPRCRRVSLSLVGPVEPGASHPPAPFPVVRPFQLPGRPGPGILASGRGVRGRTDAVVRARRPGVGPPGGVPLVAACPGLRGGGVLRVGLRVGRPGEAVGLGGRGMV